jgi:Transposase
MEKFSFEAEKGKHTKLFEQYVQYSRWVMAGSAIGLQTGCSSGKIHKILKNLDPESINKEWIERMKTADRIYLGIDEHSFRGRDYVLVITDIRERIPLAVLNDNKMTTIEKWMNSLPVEVIKKIDWVANDMHRGYKNVIEAATRKDLWVVDKFHLFQEANRMVDEVRKINTWLIKMNVVEKDQFITQKKVPKDVQMKQSETVVHSKYKLPSDAKILDESTFKPDDLINKKGEVTEFKEITLSFYLNSGGYRGLIWTREKNLSGIQRLRLRQILREFDWKGYMTEAWSLKERFCDAMDEKDIDEIKDVMLESLNSEHYRVKEFGRTIKRWFKQIMNFCEHNEWDFSPTNAYTECFNGQCKTAKRVSYWFRHKDNYRRKLGSRFTEKIKKSRLEIENRKKVEKSFENQSAIS